MIAVSTVGLPLASLLHHVNSLAVLPIQEPSVNGQQGRPLPNVNDHTLTIRLHRYCVTTQCYLADSVFTHTRRNILTLPIHTDLYRLPSVRRRPTAGDDMQRIFRNGYSLQ